MDFVTANKQQAIHLKDEQIAWKVQRKQMTLKKTYEMVWLTLLWLVFEKQKHFKEQCNEEENKNFKQRVKSHFNEVTFRTKIEKGHASFFSSPRQWSTVNGILKKTRSYFFTHQSQPPILDLYRW